MEVLSAPHAGSMRDMANAPFSQIGTSNAFLPRSSTLPLSSTRITSAYGTRESGSMHSPISGARRTPRSLSPAVPVLPSNVQGLDALSVWESPLTAPIPRAREVSTVDNRFAASGLSRPFASSTGSNYTPQITPRGYGGYYERQVGDVGRPVNHPPNQQVVPPGGRRQGTPLTPPPGSGEVQVSDTIEALKVAGLRRLDRLETGLSDIRGQLAELCSRRAGSQKGSPEGPRFDDLERSRTLAVPEESIAVQELLVAHDKLLTEHGRRQERLNRLEDQLQSLLPLEVQLPRARQELREAEDRERIAREEVAELSAVKKWASASADGGLACTELAQMSLDLDRHRVELERVRCELHDARGASESATAEARHGRERAEMLELEVQRLFPLEQKLKETTEELHRVTEESKNSQAELQVTQEQLSSAESRWAALRVELANAQKELSSRAAARGEMLDDNPLFADPGDLILQGDAIAGLDDLARAREELALAEEERNRIQQERAAAAAAFLAEVELQDALDSGFNSPESPKFNHVDDESGFNGATSFDIGNEQKSGFGDADDFNVKASWPEDSNGFGDAPDFNAAPFPDSTDFNASAATAFGINDGFGESTNFSEENVQNGFRDTEGIFGGNNDVVAFPSGDGDPWLSQEFGVDGPTSGDHQWLPWSGDDSTPRLGREGEGDDSNMIKPSQSGYANGLRSDSSSSASEDSITPSQSASRTGSPQLERQLPSRPLRKQERECTAPSPQSMSIRPQETQLSDYNPYRAVTASGLKKAERPGSHCPACRRSWPLGEAPSRYCDRCPNRVALLSGMLEDYRKKSPPKIKVKLISDSGRAGGVAAPSSPPSSHKELTWAQGTKKQSSSAGGGPLPNTGITSGNSRASKASPPASAHDLSWAQGKSRTSENKRMSQFSFSAGSNERETGSRRVSLPASRSAQDKSKYSPGNPFADPLPATQGGFSPLNPFATA